MNVNYVRHNVEMDRIAEAFSGYIHRHPCLDLLWSEKAGYLILTITLEPVLGNAARVRAYL